MKNTIELPARTVHFVYPKGDEYGRDGEPGLLNIAAGEVVLMAVPGAENAYLGDVYEVLEHNRVLHVPVTLKALSDHYRPLSKFLLVLPNEILCLLRDVNDYCADLFSDYYDGYAEID